MTSGQPKSADFPAGQISVFPLRGASALSEFRRDKLLGEIQQQATAVEDLEARYWHFAALRQPLSETEAKVLVRLQM